jgi:hypothetical protein
VGIGRWLDSPQSGRSRALSKLVLDLKVSEKYDKATLSDIIRTICTQVNTLSEGRITARYQAQVSVPASVAAAVSDIVWDSNATVRPSVAPGVASSYIRIGWVCTVDSTTNATWQELRVLTGA